MCGRYYRRSDKQKIAEAVHATSCGVTVQPRSRGPRNPDKHQTSNGKFGICLRTTTRQPSSLPQMAKGCMRGEALCSPSTLSKNADLGGRREKCSNDEGDLLSAAMTPRRKQPHNVGELDFSKRLADSLSQPKQLAPIGDRTPKLGEQVRWAIARQFRQS